MLAGGPAEWRDALARLLTDGDLRHRLAAGGVETVAERYTVDRVGPLLAAGLWSALDDTTRMGRP